MYRRSWPTDEPEMGQMARALGFRSFGIDLEEATERSGARVRALGLYFQKAAVDPVTLESHPTFAAINSTFVASLAQTSIVDRVSQDNAWGATLPYSNTATAVGLATMAAYTVAELSPKPISVPAYGGATSYTKTVAFIVVSEDVLRQPFAAERLEVELRRAISGGTNGAFLELLAALADTQTASGSTAAAVATDLAVALATLGTSASSRLYLAVSPSTLSELALRTDTAGSLAFPNLGATGGEIGGIEVLASDSLETSPPSAILFDSTKLVLGDSGIRLQASRHGSVEMSNTPGGSAAYSLWQRNATGIRAERSLQLGAAQPDTSGGHFAAVVIQNAW